MSEQCVTIGSNSQTRIIKNYTWVVWLWGKQGCMRCVKINPHDLALAGPRSFSWEPEKLVHLFIPKLLFKHLLCVKH